MLFRRMSLLSSTRTRSSRRAAFESSAVVFSFCVCLVVVVLRSASSVAAVAAAAAINNHHADDPEEEVVVGANVEPHPDLNEEHHAGMVFVGRLCDETGQRLSADHDNTVRYVFGTAFDDSHQRMELRDLEHEQRTGPDAQHDIPGEVHDYDGSSSSEQRKTREQVLKERRHKNLTEAGPVPFGHVDTHPLDGGVTPVVAVSVEPFWLDEVPVTNKEFAKFVSATYYETEAEKYGWSFVLSSFAAADDLKQPHAETDPDAEHWVAIPGAYWRQPEGSHSSYKFRENHPVVHVSHRDAAEYCTWKGKRLPGEREYEAAARANHWSSVGNVARAIHNRTAYAWGDFDTTTAMAADWDTAARFANLWGPGRFPDANDAADGWRGTSPVRHYPPNAAGVYDTTGNVWEWMRGGKNRARIVRGASHVDSLDGSFNHAATLGARAVVHGTTTTGNIGFRCAKAVPKRVEHHWTWHDEEVHGRLAVEDEFGKRDMIPTKGWEDQFSVDDDDDEEEEVGNEDEFESDAKPQKRKKKKVVLKRERISSEL